MKTRVAEGVPVDVLNGGEVVGTLEDARPDMWYLEGRFTPADTPAGARFVAAASALDVRVTYNNHARAIRSSLRESPEDEGTIFVVMSLSGGNLFGRRVFEQSAVEWVTTHVPEQSPNLALQRTLPLSGFLGWLNALWRRCR